jgi:hypothetical protein
MNLNRVFPPRRLKFLSFLLTRITRSAKRRRAEKCVYEKNMCEEQAESSTHEEKKNKII